MQLTDTKHLTPADYLALERQSEEQDEHDGFGLTLKDAYVDVELNPT